jgi:hypothetical protein
VEENPLERKGYWQRYDQAADASRTNMSVEQAEKELGADIRAKYKIDITFGPDRTPQGPNIALLQIWESGKHFHGGGDDKMYWCKDVREGHDDGCWGPIPSSHMSGPFAYCHHCLARIDIRYLTGERIVKLTTDKLAEAVEATFHRLEHSADIYCKYHPQDIRYQAMLREKGFEKARQLKGMFIYTLAAIIKDTASGASLHGRFKAFLSA